MLLIRNMDCQLASTWLLEPCTSQCPFKEHREIVGKFSHIIIAFETKNKEIPFELHSSKLVSFLSFPQKLSIKTYCQKIIRTHSYNYTCDWCRLRNHLT